jgi:polyhydroxybutyrate depolymerase
MDEGRGLERRQEGLEPGSIEVAGIRRTYWLARAPQRPGYRSSAPLLIVLHGSGMDGRTIARFTGLDRRGPAAGIATVFPDGWKGVWHPARAPDGVPDLDDALFLAQLCAHLEVDGAARSWPVFLAGVSNGAWFAEHLARHALLPVTGLFLVAGTALEFSRRLAPVPLLRTTVVMMMGTADRAVPYSGGPLSRRGLSGILLRRRAARHGEQPGEDLVAGAETVAADWATGNGIRSGPATEELQAAPGDLPVTRKTWSAPACRPVTLYRIEGGGHSWPGGPQLLPARAIGPGDRHLDATGILLDLAEHERGNPQRHRTLRRATTRSEPRAAPPWEAGGA